MSKATKRPRGSREYNGPPGETQRFSDRLRFDQCLFWDSEPPIKSECGVSASAWAGEVIEEFWRPGRVRCGGGWRVMMRENG